jgi:hypothetical protein
MERMAADFPPKAEGSSCACGCATAERRAGALTLSDLVNRIEILAAHGSC